jgi:hypothetical protein
MNTKTLLSLSIAFTLLFAIVTACPRLPRQRSTPTMTPTLLLSTHLLFHLPNCYILRAGTVTSPSGVASICTGPTGNCLDRFIQESNH